MAPVHLLWADDSTCSVAHLYSRTGTGKHQPVLWFGPSAWRAVGKTEDVSGFAGVEHRSLLVGRSHRGPHYTGGADVLGLACHSRSAGSMYDGILVTIDGTVG